MDAYLDVGRRERKRQALHETLLVTAENLFRERGITGTTVDDIADAADVARQTVFNHFPYKEAFALELGAFIVHQIGQRAQALLEIGTPAVEVLVDVGGWVLDAALENSEVATAVARELLHCDGERAARAAAYVPLEGLLEALLEQARDEGGVRGDLPLDIAASRLSAVVAGVISQAACRPADELRRNMSVSFDLLLNGLVRRSE